MEKNIIIEFSEETGNYLQRLGTEVDAKAYLLDYMFSNHAQDDDVSLFDSKPFQHFMKQYEQAQAEFTLAKVEFENTYLKPEVYKQLGNIPFTWKIDDYTSHQCIVSYK